MEGSVIKLPKFYSGPGLTNCWALSWHAMTSRLTRRA